ncbi:MAG TPA: hypothetical protein VFX85_12515 [Solirubrobacterales bacterium]|nr:hypothetical protein [Solirubrobacterales bacterium]
MTHKLRKLGLALVLALAIASTATAVARAEALQFYAESIPATLSATSSEDVLTTTVGSLKCSTTSYAGTLGEMGAAAVDLTPTSSGCVAFGMTGEVNPNGCAYRLNAGEYSGGKGVGDVDIVCPGGNEITVVGKLSGVTKCTLHIPAQSDVTGSVAYTNVEGSAVEISAELSLSGIDYFHTKGTGLGACTAGFATNGTYAETIAIKGKTEAEAETAVALLAPKPLFVTDPNPLDFKGGGLGSLQVTIENKDKDEKPKIDVFGEVGPFVAKRICGNKQLDVVGQPKAKCLEEIECKATGTDGNLILGASAHYAMFKATLKKC